MARDERLYQLKQWLAAGRCTTPTQLQQTLEVSRATRTRDITMLRERFNMPIEWDKERGGWIPAANLPTLVF